jgi:hypothetical protein
MFDVIAFLDRAKACAGNVSDYRLAKLIGVTPATVSGWRAGHRAPDGRSIVKLCELSRDDPDQVAAEIQVMRSSSEEEAALWRRVASRLSGSVAAAVVCFVLVAGFAPSPAMASSTDDGLYIMSTLLLLRLLCGVVQRVRYRNQNQAVGILPDIAPGR